MIVLELGDELVAGIPEHELVAAWLDAAAATVAMSPVAGTNTLEQGRRRDQAEHLRAVAAEIRAQADAERAARAPKAKRARR